jgi:hypothetical protein
MLSQPDPGCESVEAWMESRASVSPPAHAGHDNLFLPRPHLKVVVEGVLDMLERIDGLVELPGSEVGLVERLALTSHPRWLVEPRSSQPRQVGPEGAGLSSEDRPGLVVGPPAPSPESTSV